MSLLGVGAMCELFMGPPTFASMRLMAGNSLLNKLSKLSASEIPDGAA
jgi:hypothetical protein